MIINWAKLMLIELITLNVLFRAYPGQDLAYILACSLSIICGFGMRIVLLYSGGKITVTKKLVVLQFFATLFISYVAYIAWEQLFKDVWFFKLFGLQLYLIFCSYLSLVILQQIDKVGKLSLDEVFKYYAKKYVKDGDKEGKI